MLLMAAACMAVAIVVGALEVDARAADAPTGVSTDTIIVAIVFDAPPAEDQDALRELIDLHPGDQYSPLAVSRSIKLLYNLGRFPAVRAWTTPTDGGVILTFQIEPLFTISSISFEGNRQLSDEELKSVLTIKAGAVYQPLDASRQRWELILAHLEAGFSRVQVSLQTVPNPATQSVALTYLIEEGPRTRISRIEFHGSLALEERTIRAKLGVSRGDPVSLTHIRAGIRRVRQFYFDNGYFDAAVDLLGPGGAPTAGVVHEMGSSQWQRWGLISHGIVALSVTPGPRISFSFTGNRMVGSKELHEVIAFDSASTPQLDSRGVEGLRTALLQRLQRLGFLNAVVTASDERSADGATRSITFTIREGNRVKVSRVTFAGNKGVSEKDLRDQVKGRLYEEQGDEEQEDLGAPSFAGIDGGHAPGEWRRDDQYPPPRKPSVRRADDPSFNEVYIPRLYEETLVEHLNAYYVSRGYLRAVVGKPLIIYNGPRQRIEVRFPVEEGPQTRIRRIDFTGLKTLTPAVVLDLMKIHQGDPLNSYAFADASRRVRIRYADAGYVYCQIRLEAELDEQDPTNADVSVTLTEGPEVRVRAIIVKGLKFTKESVILDRLTFRQGDVFTPAAVRASQEYILKLGVVQAATIRLFDEERVEAEKTVVISVIERPPGDIEFGGGVSTDEGLRARFDFTYRNLGGLALEAHLKTQVNYAIPQLLDDDFARIHKEIGFNDWLERTVTVGVRYPAIWGASFPLGVGFDITHLRAQERSYGMDRNSGLLYFDSQPQRAVSVTSSIELSWYDLQLTHVPLRSGEAITQPEGKSFEVSPQINFSGNWVDNLFVPTKGVRMSLAIGYYSDIASSIDTSLLRGRLSLSGYVPIRLPLWVFKSRPLVLRVQGRIGYIHNFISDSVGEDKRFFLGGRQSLRGWQEQAVYPEDLSDAQIEQIKNEDLPSPGGLSYVQYGVELRVPVYRSYSVGFFMDAGQLWQDAANLHADITRYRYSMGVGAHYATAIGEINLDFGGVINPDRRIPARPWNIHFSISFF